jgi:hypothetical protein
VVKGAEGEEGGVGEGVIWGKDETPDYILSL